MGRSGYTDDYDEMFPNACALYRANLDRAMAGKRGQTFLKDLLARLDAMPEKRLITGQLEEAGEVCALGVMTRARNIDTSELKFNTPKNADWEDDDFVIGCLSDELDITEGMVREIMFMNDEAVWSETPDMRWQRMRRWVEKHIKVT